MKINLVHTVRSHSQQGATWHPHHFPERGCVRRTSRSKARVPLGFEFSNVFLLQRCCDGLPAQSRSGAGAKLRPTQRGIMLVDCMVYVAVFFLVLGVGFKMFYSCWDSSKAFRRNADQIAATLKTGERWREDVRRATAALQPETSPEGTLLRIPQNSGEVDYRFSDDTLWRRDGASGDWIPVLLHVKSSRMEPDRREKVSAWRWEVELASRRKGARVVPLFTFQAVPQLAH